jgi:cell division protein FtsL
MKKPALTIGFLLFVILALSLVKIFVSNGISTSGVVLSDVSDRINNYKVENVLLSEKLYSLSSLTNVLDKANSLGFVEAKSSFVLTNPIPIALKQ